MRLFGGSVDPNIKQVTERSKVVWGQNTPDPNPTTLTSGKGGDHRENRTRSTTGTTKISFLRLRRQ